MFGRQAFRMVVLMTLLLVGVAPANARQNKDLLLFPGLALEFPLSPSSSEFKSVYQSGVLFGLGLSLQNIAKRPLGGNWHGVSSSFNFDFGYADEIWVHHLVWTMGYGIKLFGTKGTFDGLWVAAEGGWSWFHAETTASEPEQEVSVDDHGFATVGVVKYIAAPLEFGMRVLWSIGGDELHSTLLFQIGYLGFGK